MSLNLTGHGGDNALYGNSGDNILRGLDGNDRLNGREGDDDLWGGSGADVFAFDARFGRDLIADFENGIDKIDMSSLGMTYSQLSSLFTQNGNDVWITLSFRDVIVLSNTQLAQLDASDFIL